MLPRMARHKPDPASSAEIGARLAMTRRSLGATQAEMAKLMGSVTNGQAWSNYESGRRCISIGHALELCRTCGLTLDWIYQGKGRGRNGSKRVDTSRDG